MNVPWEDAPEWANYSALDPPNDLFWFENMPFIDMMRFKGEAWCVNEGIVQFAGNIECDIPWKETLTERPIEYKI